MTHWVVADHLRALSTFNALPYGTRCKYRTVRSPSRLLNESPFPQLLRGFGRLFRFIVDQRPVYVDAMTADILSGHGLQRQRLDAHWQHPWVALAITYVSYLAAARIGLSLVLPDGISPVWPASGVALAMVLRFGNKVAIAVFAANLTVQILWAPPALPIWAFLLFALGAALEPLISGQILKKWCRFDSRLPRLHDIVMLAIIGAPAGSLLNSLLAAVTYCASGLLAWAQFLACLETFWFGNAGGILILAVPLLAWMPSPDGYAITRTRRPRRFAEATAISVLLALLPLGLPISILHSLKADPDAIAFLCFPLIAWASIRLDLKLSTLITFLVSVESIATARWPNGLFWQTDPDEVLFIIQLFVLSLNATNQLLSGLARQEQLATDRLGEREEFLSLAVLGSNDGLFDFDRATYRLWLSPRWKEQLGYRDEDLPNDTQTWWRLILKEDRHKAISTFKTLDLGTMVKGECLLRFHHQAGHVTHILCRAAVHRSPTGRVARLVGTHTDITDLMTTRQELEHQTASLTRLARDLNQQRRLAEAANEAKTNFLATVSHEVRTPLNGVIGMLNLLVDSDLRESQRKQAKVALTSADDMLTIINDILDVTKLEAGRVALDAADCDLHALIEGVVALFSGRALSKGVSLSAEIAGNVPHYIHGDQSRIRQILMNLVGNAVKFTLNGDIVMRVTTAPMTRLTNAAGDLTPALRFYLMFDVSDTGIGIPTDKIDRLFDRFQQADQSITRRFGGSGLGLTICKQLVDLMGGQISVDSKPGIGSTFHVALPCTLGRNPDEHPQSDGNHEIEIRPCRILVVEDNAVNSAVVTEMLARVGHQVTVADNGSAALMTLGRQQFDAILMDVQMPEMDGITATQWIRALDDPRAHIPIIALTADTMSGSRERYLTAGFSDYLEKPVRANKLIDTIARHVARRPDSYYDTMNALDRSVAESANTAHIDLQQLEAMRQHLNAGDILRMISNMEVEIEFDLRRLKIAVAVNDRDACRQALQALADDAMQIGAVGLADYSRELATIANDINAVFAALSQLQQGAIRAVAQLRGHVTTKPVMEADNA
jgi:PAS domain S-box-containing protein